MGVFVAPFIFDLILTVITLVTAFQLWRAWLRPSWLHLFLKEGLMYFVVLTALNCRKHLLLLSFGPYSTKSAPFILTVNMGRVRRSWASGSGWHSQLSDSPDQLSTFRTINQ